MPEPIRILHVDDYPLDRQLVRDALEKEHEGFRVTEAASRQEFEARLAKGDYDIVLADFNILGFEGLEVMDAVRERDPGVPVLIVTGTGSEEVAVEAMRRGAADYVIKTPEHIRRLPHTVQAAIEKNRLLHEHTRMVQALRTSQERYERAIEAGQVGVWDWNLETDECYVALNLKDLLGYEDHEIRNHLDDWGKHVHPDDIEQVMAAIEGHVRGETPQYELEHRMLHKDGSVRWVLARGIVIRDEKGKPVRVAGTDTDITERKLMEEQLLGAQRMEAVGQLAAGIAHDFNNLLTSINGFTELMQSRMAADDPMRDWAGKILGSGQRAAYLVSQLLAFSRKQMIAPRMLSPNDIVTEMDQMLRQTIGDDIKLTVILAPDLWPVNLDPIQFKQVISDLTANARRGMPDGGRLTIETANVALGEEQVAEHLEVTEGDYVLLAVSDTGGGMSQEAKERIFEPFFITSQGVADGVGLRMAAVYGMVKQNRGYIWVESEAGQGTTFKVYLPRATETA
ncbi:MAG: PAS domain-containing protein [Ardenticatenia bacterium]|nr:PAS domain-containing protein [Ardenticatenia bacterium]